jgi:catechol 2,3-dioxygenase-like lactoylglutathione lyase family enzyme
MFMSGNVTVYVSNMDSAVRFYSEVLGLRLVQRFGDHWASVEAAKGLTIGLHPDSGKGRAGRKGGMEIGLELEGSIRDAVRVLEAKGVQFHGPIHEDASGSFAFLEDPDGNPIYLAELKWGQVGEGEGQYQNAR